MKLGLITLASIAATSALVGCGGGGDGGPTSGVGVTPGTTVTFSEAPAAAMQVKAGTVFDLRAVANSYGSKLTNLAWSVTPDKPTLPALSLTNADCSGSSRSTTPLLNNASATRWACASAGLAPLVNATSNYRVRITGEDAAGNQATRDTVITVTPLNQVDLQVLRPTVAGSTSVMGQAGGQVNAVCFGKEQSGGANKVTYEWSLVSNNSGRKFSIENAQSSNAIFNLPALAVGETDAVAIARCTVTDSNGYTNSMDTTIHARAVYSPPPIVTAPNAILATVGQSANLSCKGAGGFVSNVEEGLSYQWVIKSNPDNLGVTMSGNSTSSLVSLVTALPGGKKTSDVVFQCRVTDDALRTATVDVNVTFAVNEAMVGFVQANAGPSQIVTSASVVTLDGTGTKYVGGSLGVGGATPLFYQWTQIGGSANVSLSGANTATPSFIAPEVTDTPVTLKFQMVATSQPQTAAYDPAPNEVSTVEVLVGGYTPPTLTVSPDIEVNANTPVSLTATGTSSEPGTMFYRWTQVDGPTVELDGQNTATVRFESKEGTVTMRVEASQDPTFPPMSTTYADAKVTGIGQ